MRTTARLIAAGASDVGRKRKENEDRIYLDAERGVFLVVDGLGGHAAGERAAEIAVEIIRARLERQTGTVEQRAREAFALASTEIHRQAMLDPSLQGMACVATLALLEDDVVTVAHVGDSRLYLLEPGEIRKITRDHSPVGELEDAGTLNEKAAMRHPRRNEVYRDLGGAEHTPNDPDFVEIERFDLPTRAALLLCSDGLSDQVTSSEIREIVERYASDPERATQSLVAAANAAGGKDNVSVVLVETAEYGDAAQVSAEQPIKQRASGWPWFFAGVLLSALAFYLLLPHLKTRSGTSGENGPRTITVGLDGMATISQALESAKPGDRILVPPGEYHESLQLRSGVSLISTEPEGAKVQSDDVAVRISGVKQVRVEGFEIKGPGKVGISIDSSEVELVGVTISGMSDAGIEIAGDGRAIIQASTIHDNAGMGIRVHGTASPIINHNSIISNGRGVTPLPGISIEGSANPLITGNIIARNGAEQMWVSPLFHDTKLSANNVISPEARNRNRLIRVVTR